MKWENHNEVCFCDDNLHKLLAYIYIPKHSNQENILRLNTVPKTECPIVQ